MASGNGASGDDFYSRLARRTVRFGDVAERARVSAVNAESGVTVPDETDGGSQRALYGGEPGDSSAVLGGDGPKRVEAPPSGMWSAREEAPPLGQTALLRAARGGSAQRARGACRGSYERRCWGDDRDGDGAGAALRRAQT